MDDHVMEPPDVWGDGRIASKYQDRAPRAIDLPDGAMAWEYEGEVLTDYGVSAAAGRPKDEWTLDPIALSDVRPGAWDIHHRVRDMDLDGVYAQVIFPGVPWGFAGRIFAATKDQELGLEVLRGYNRWHLEVLAGTYPNRVIPMQLPWLADPKIAAEEIRANAEAGFKAVSFADNPANLGFPPISSEEWDPFLKACEETETVVCLHIGASDQLVTSRPDAPIEVITSLFASGAMVAATEWIWGAIPIRFPNLKVALSEGGIGWVPMLIDRLDYVVSRSGSHGDGPKLYAKHGLSPSEALREHFWFCILDDPSILEIRDRIGVDHIMVETDYPHADTTWPNSQDMFSALLDGMPDDEVQKMTHLNAAKLFRHPLPDAA
ncbi:MAG: amidohydrolase family protein [bacterium]|nr:amidohydrolase family protein [bacterium]